MAYAVEQDIADRYGADALLVVADRDGDGFVDSDIVETALVDAGAEIDAYLTAKYDLPLKDVPPVLTRLSVDIALYRLSGDAGALTEERRQRYEDAIKLLEAISTGKASLGLENPPASVGSVWSASKPRLFKRR